jgi:hypothetical protein
MSMDRREILLVVASFVVLALLVLAPWMDNQASHDMVLEEKGPLDGTIDREGNMICDYNVMWFPFGRWVVSCEGGWFVTFYGGILS